MITFGIREELDIKDYIVEAIIYHTSFKRYYLPYSFEEKERRFTLKVINPISFVFRKEIFSIKVNLNLTSLNNPHIRLQESFFFIIYLFPYLNKKAVFLLLTFLYSLFIFYLKAYYGKKYFKEE